MLKRAFNVLLEGVPDTIDYDQLRHRLSEISGTCDAMLFFCLVGGVVVTCETVPHMPP